MCILHKCMLKCFIIYSASVQFSATSHTLHQFSSVTQSCPILCNPTNCSMHGLPTITNSRSLLRLMSSESVMPSDHLILRCPLLLLPLILPIIKVFSNESVLRIRWPASASKEFQLQHESFQWILRTDFLENGLVGPPCCSRDSQESLPTPQFKSINSLALSFLYSPSLTSIYDYWKNHSFD